MEDFVCSKFDQDLFDLRQKNIFNNINTKKLNCWLKTFCKINFNSLDHFNREFKKYQKIYKIVPKKNQLYVGYQQLLETNNINRNHSFEKYIITKKIRILSGVTVITVLTSPGNFSCPKDCHYCPNEPGQPRSYLMKEPAVQRANRNNFDPIKQFYDRATTYFINGYSVDKIEILVLGGTWSSYPVAYQEEFIRDLYYSANVFFNKKRNKLSLLEEQKINETSKCRIIGLTLETRPDYITWKEINRFRKYGCTRVQLGIQHTDQKILDKINRGCTTKDAIKALTMLKDCGYKIDAHFMPDLPGSSPLQDWNMFNYVLQSNDLQFDQWKIYPCEITPYTKIKEWYENGEYTPYCDINEKLLFNLIMLVKNRVHPWIRLNRVIRDIPNNYILGGNKITNLRQQLHKDMKKYNLECSCIRCREVKDNNIVDPTLYCRIYNSNGGTEYFISYESKDKKIIYGFIRLRLTKNSGNIYRRSTSKNNTTYLCFPELQNCALIRELHVYGQVVSVGQQKKDATQHYGFGKRLLLCAEYIAYKNGFRKIAVISGVGVKQYYKKYNYKHENTYMIKQLHNCNFNEYINYINNDTKFIPINNSNIKNLFYDIVKYDNKLQQLNNIVNDYSNYYYNWKLIIVICVIIFIIYKIII
jgi:ELP3 family radical SAM enzyme/protein acetyltransferase